MTTKEIEQEVRFLAPFQPLKAPKSISGFRLVKTIPQKSETFYFDTADEELFRKKSTLRIRKFYGEWLITFKAQETDPSKSSETSQPIRKEDLDDILRGKSRIQDLFEDPTLLPVNPLSLAGYLITHRLALRYRKKKEEVEVAFDECRDDLPIAPFHVAEIENKTASEDSFQQIRKCFVRLLPVIPTSLSKYMIMRKRQRDEPIQETFNLDEGIKETVRTIKSLLRTAKDRPLVVFVAGGSASGKTDLFAKKLSEQIKDIRLLSMDDCFYGSAWMKANNRKNWDDPAAMDISLFRQWIKILRSGKSLAKKVYKFGKTDGAETINPPRVIIAEGIHALHETLDDIPGLRIFVDATTHCRFIRRMYRDALKGRTDQTPQEVFHQFFDTVEPSHQQWVEPTKAKAHIVVENTYDPLREAKAIERSDVQLKMPGHVPEVLLLRLGAHLVSREPQLDTYFRPPTQDITKRGEILRVRRNGPLPNNLVITYKAIPPSGQVRFDVPITSEDFAQFQTHYTQFAIIRKNRTTFTLDDIMINLDTIDGLGEWVEFYADKPENEQFLKNLMERLGFDPSQATTETYLSMMLKKMLKK